MLQSELELLQWKYCHCETELDMCHVFFLIVKHFFFFFFKLCLREYNTVKQFGEVFTRIRLSPPLSKAWREER